MNRQICLRFVEPSLAHYRVPFFRAMARQFDVEVFYAESGRINAEPDGFRATFAPRKTLKVLGHPVYWQSAQLDAIDSGVVDVVSFDWDVHYASLAPALLKAKRQSISTILWGHGVSKNDGTWKAWPRRTLANLADVLVTYSPDARQSYLNAGWPESRVFCAFNAIDQSPLQAAYDLVRKNTRDEADAVAQIRRGLGIEVHAPVVLFASRLDPVRRLDVLIDAIARLNNPSLQVVLIGDGPERATVLEQAQRLGVADRLRFVGGVYDETELARWYAAADVVVHPAWLGLSVYHAMGHGRAVITGNDSAYHPPEAASVVHEETGLRFRHGDADACAAAIDRLLNDSPLRLRLGQTACDRARREHSIDAMVDGFSQAVQAAVRRR